MAGPASNIEVLSIFRAVVALPDNLIDDRVMKISAKDLVTKGYFFNELPPCFTSIEYGNNFYSFFNENRLDQIATSKGYKVSECVYYSIPKAGFNRRTLGIPNPLHYSALAYILSNNAAAIGRNLKSTISCSLPTNYNGPKAFKTEKNFPEFRRHCFLISEEATFELKMDISRYYPTIYTHIIPWALHGKLLAKKKQNDPSLLGNIIDKYTRAMQSGQTMGIPIGPDASLIISELIGSKLDEEIRKKFPKIRAARYIDDYYFYFTNRSDAESVLKFVQSLFSDYLLTCNEEKTRLKEFPFSTDPLWIISLRSLKSTYFNNGSKPEQEEDIRQFFSAAFDWAEKNPNDEVMKFAVKSLYGVKISKDNWDYYQAWLTKMGLYDPYTLPEICAIFYTNRQYLDGKQIKLFVHQLLERHVSKRHSFEVAWTLWLAKIMGIKINKPISEKLFDGSDTIPTLMALDLKHQGLIPKTASSKNLNVDLNSSALHDGRWLLAYEAYTQGWLKVSKTNSKFIKDHNFFSVLEQNKISFYDSKKMQAVIPIKKAPFLTAEQEESIRSWFATGSYRSST